MRQIRAFCGNQGCVDSETEFLTPSGWKKIGSYNNEPIGVYSANGEVTFEYPSRYIVTNADKWYLLKSSHGVDQKLSPEHNVYYITSKGNIYHKSMQEIYENHQTANSGFKGKFITTFKSTFPDIKISDDMLRLFIAVQADGTLLKQKDKVSVNLKKERKIKRLRELLQKCNIKSTECIGKEGTSSEGYVRFYFYLPNAFKEFPLSWWKCSNRQLNLITEEVVLWDGYVSKVGAPEYFSNNSLNVDFIQYAFTCSGYRGSFRIDDRRGKGHIKNVNYSVAGCKRSLITLHPKKESIVETEVTNGEMKYCFTTSTGMWVARRNKCIFITGNSGKDFSCSRLMMTKGFKKLAFADALRDIAFKVLNIPFDIGMKNYDKLKITPLVNNLTFRNILENLGSGVRRYDRDFWAKTVLALIKESTENICISDLRYYNEYTTLRDFAKANDIDFRLVFCDYHGENYRDDNPHESAALANYLKKLGYKDQQYVEDFDMEAFGAING